MKLKFHYWGAVAGVLVIAALVLARSGQSRTTPVPSATPKPAVSANAAAAAKGIGLEDIGGPMVKFVLELAADPAKKFIMEQLGLPTTESQLQELSTKIDALSAQLQATESRLSGQIEELDLQGKIEYLADQENKLKSLLQDDFVPLARALKDLKDEEQKSPTNQGDIQTAKERVTKWKEAFLRDAAAFEVTTITGDIHHRLQPGIGLQGVLRKYGSFIMSKHRILTHSDSQKVEELYTWLEDNQALATWMSIERQLAITGDYDHAKPEIDRFIGYLRNAIEAQRNPKAENGLLPAIPVGVAIDRGPNTSTTLYSTRNKAMFTDVFGVFPYAPWPDSGSDSHWHSPPPTTVQTALRVHNDEKLRGFTSWGVPDDNQLNGLFSLRSPNTDPLNYLAGIFGGAANLDPAASWIWVSNTGTERCFNGESFSSSYPAHLGRSRKDYSLGLHPAGLLCAAFNPKRDYEEGRFREAKGGLVPVRRTGSDEDYVSTPSG